MLSSVTKRLIQLLIFLYQVILSPIIHFLAGTGFGCRFEPSCSDYASEALQIHGLSAGGFLTIRRICRCHPFAEAGFDPVPRAIAGIKHQT